MLYPLTFQPRYKERVWGGRNLQRLYRRALPPDVPIGESWEISDRPGDESVITHGSLAGKTLRWLMESRREDLLGTAQARKGRFPLLVKILDAQDKLSLQVHPTAAVAPQLHGEPKTELWFITHASPGAELYVGLRSGVTKARFARQLREGTIAGCFHRIPASDGDAMFLPSGRVHAIGAGLVLFEIQQNSDTTYRVFDWNRLDLGGKPRELHINEAIASIDFTDYEPSLVEPFASVTLPGCTLKHLVRDEAFTVTLIQSKEGGVLPSSPGQSLIWGVMAGFVEISHGEQKLDLLPGQFCLLPANSEPLRIRAGPSTSILEARPG